LAGLAALDGKKHDFIATENSQSTQGADIDRERLSELFRTLGSLLDNMAPEAEEVLDEIRVILKHSPHWQAVAKIGDCLDEYDFECAKPFLAELYAKLDIPTD
jgi:hypothetical protein